ncbi:hypothetical protein [Asanoa siamensis]|uniref:Lipoprotein n=1 Tax=Asanoa siamensis TaxID=926357 RepID=A0ABQ4CLV1_9ACTN|nr:hypothetical protein [Asanoa siamensis]GIF72265.1 hypothetical protein Asi02nite_17830 [Asanoa siamensis]
MRITMPLAGALATLLLATACGSPVQHQAGDAAPAGQPAPTTAAATPTAPTTSAPPSTKPALVLGPDGYGALKLGMSVKQAEATGLVGTFDNSGCRLAKLNDSPPGQARGLVHWSPEHGIVSIAGWPGLETAEGVRVGTSETEMRRIYPNWTAVDSGRGFAAVSDNARYRITVSDGKVTSVTLQSNNQNCYE